MAQIANFDIKSSLFLHLTCEEGYVDGVRLLLQRCLDIHARDDESWTPFQIASVNGHQKVMKLLLDHGAAAAAAAADGSQNAITTNLEPRGVMLGTIAAVFDN